VVSKEEFFDPRSPYYGNPTAANIVFNSNLQEFGNKVELICGLETGGKLDPKVAYKQIKKLWKELKATKKELLDNPDLQGRVEDEE
jgi:hypothetical protein